MTEDQKIAKRAQDAKHKREKRAAEKAQKAQAIDLVEATQKIVDDANPARVGAAQTILDIAPRPSIIDGIPDGVAVASPEVHRALWKAGFSFIRTEQGASGYSHADGRAILIQTNGVWVLRFSDGTQTGGASQDSLLELLAKTKTPKAVRVEAARARGRQGAASSGEKKVAKKEPAVQALDIIANAKDAAVAQVEARVIAAAEGRPLNVVRAVEMLKGVTEGRFDVQNLRGDKHYSDRMALLRVLFNREKGGVKAAETGITNVVQAFYSALGPVGSCAAAKAVDFAERCTGLLVATHAAQLLAGKAARKAVKAVQRRVAPSLAVPGTILPAVKPLGHKAQREADDVVRREVYVEALDVELEAVPKPLLRNLDVILARNLRLLDHPGGLVSLKLERCNSQGSLQIYAVSGHRLHCGVMPQIYEGGSRLCCGVLTPVLAVGVKARPYDLGTVLSQVDAWLTDEYEKDSEMEDTLKKVKTAIKRQTEPVKLAPAPFTPAAPREGTPEPRITAASVRLLEDPRLGIILMQLEKENSQGAICVYNNSSRVSVGVVPPEILKTLRPVPGEVDLVKAANQLLNPVVPSVPVTPVAVGYLTAVLHCKEIATMSKKFEAPVQDTPKSRKFASTKSEKPAKAAKVEKAEKAPSAGRKPAIPDTAKITILTEKKANPYREGSKAYVTFDLLKQSKTAGAFREAAKADPEKYDITYLTWTTVEHGKQPAYVSLAY
jgi:hypothetical protein